MGRCGLTELSWDWETLGCFVESKAVQLHFLWLYGSAISKRIVSRPWLRYVVFLTILLMIFTSIVLGGFAFVLNCVYGTSSSFLLQRHCLLLHAPVDPFSTLGGLDCLVLLQHWVLATIDNCLGLQTMDVLVGCAVVPVVVQVLQFIQWFSFNRGVNFFYKRFVNVGAERLSKRFSHVQWPICSRREA